MKKVKEFLIALIVPRKMIKFKGLNVFLSFVVLIVGTYIALGSTLAVAEKYVLDKYTVFDGETVNVDDKMLKIDNFSIDDKNYEFTATLIGDDKGIYHSEYLLSDSRKLDLTIVLDDSINILEEVSEKNTKELKYFDLEGYYNQQQDENTKYILLIYTKRHLLYLGDLGKELVDGEYQILDSATNTIFEKDENANYVYYLPASADELVINEQYPSYYDTTKWTRKVSSEDAEIDFEYSGSLKIEPVRRHKKVINEAIYSNYSRCYLYSDLVLNGIEDLKIAEVGVKDYLNGLYKSILVIETNNEKAYNSLVAFLAVIIMPLFIVLITWLFFKGYNLRKFREYFAIYSITYATLSVVAFIIGFFIEYFTFFVIWWIAQICYYFFVTLRINTMEEKKDEDGENKTEEVKEEELKFKNVQDNYSRIG